MDEKVIPNMGMKQCHLTCIRQLPHPCLFTKMRAILYSKPHITTGITRIFFIAITWTETLKYLRSFVGKFWGKNLASEGLVNMKSKIKSLKVEKKLAPPQNDLLKHLDNYKLAPINKLTLKSIQIIYRPPLPTEWTLKVLDHCVVAPIRS